MNSMIIFTIATIFVSNAFGCELNLGQGSALCQAVQNDVNELAKAVGGYDISKECTCDAGKAKAGCDLLQTQKNEGKYKFAPVCEEIKKTLTAAPAFVKGLLNCNDQNIFKNSYAKVAECNAENDAASSSNTVMVIEASSANIMVAAESTQMMIQASSSAEPEQPAMSTAMDKDMMSSMMEDMDSAAMKPTASMDIAPSSSMEMNLMSSSVAAANEIKITHAVLVVTALVAMLFSLM